MHSVGIVRKLDSLGRIVLPAELREQFEIWHKTPLEIYVVGESIVLEKYSPKCVFCGLEGASEYKEQNVCPKCLKELKSI